VLLEDAAVHTVAHAHKGVAVVLCALRLAAGDVTLDPDPSNLPGGAVLQHLTDGLGGWALILSLVGLLIGAAAWALGAHAQNYHQAFNGRRTVLVSALAALLIGAAPALINFFFHTGQGVH
jgi:MFS family permease